MNELQPAGSVGRLLAGSVRAPKVSVVISLFNYEAFVADCIKSVAAQTYRDFECIIVDDCSTDRSGEVVKAVLAEMGDSRFSYHLLPRNSGHMAAIKAGLDRGDQSAPFVKLLDADDLLTERSIERLLRAHLNPIVAVGVAFGDMAQIAADGSVVSATFKELAKRRLDQTRGGTRLPEYADPEIDRLLGTTPGQELYAYNSDNTEYVFPTTSALMFRRAALNLVIPADFAEIKMFAEWYFLTFAHPLTGSVGTPERVAFYRRHSRNAYAWEGYLGTQATAGNPRSMNVRGMFGQMVAHIASNYDLFSQRVSRNDLDRFLRRALRLAPQSITNVAKSAKAKDARSLREGLLNMVRTGQLNFQDARALDREIGGSRLTSAYLRSRMGRLPVLSTLARSASRPGKSRRPH